MSIAKTPLEKTLLLKAADRRLPPAIWIIVKKEVSTNIFSLEIPLAFAVMTTLLVLSAHLMAIDYRQRLDNWSENQSVQDRSPVGGVAAYRMSDGVFFHTAGAVPDAALQPPIPTSVIVKGMDSEWDRTITLGQTIGFGPRQDDRPTATLFNIPDPGYIIQLLVSMLALLFSFDAITREKESGTLRALLANPLHRRQILLGKAIGSVLSLYLPFTIAYAILIAYLRFAHGLLASRDEMLIALLILCLSLIYALVFICVGLFISTATTRTETAVVTSLLAWCALVLILPDATVLSARLLYPAPSHNQLKAQLRESRQSIIGEEFSANPEIKSVFESPNARELLARTFDADRRITDEYISKKLTQVNAARYLSLLSPVGALRFSMSDLAGTGATSFQSYFQFLVFGRDRMTEAMKSQWDLPPAERAIFIQRTMRELSSRQRQFDPLSAGLGPAAAGAASLLVWSGIFWALAYRRFRYYDAR